MSGRPVLAIELKKLTGYLLDVKHPVGGSKAQYFISLGFSVDDPHGFADAIAEHARAGWPGLVTPWPYGPRHKIVGPLSTPSGATPNVCSLWEMKPDTDLARLLTAYPD